VLAFVVRRVQQTSESVDLKETQLLLYAGIVNWLGESTNTCTMKRSTGDVLKGSRSEVVCKSTEKAK
jgi:hypothetical protein